MLGNVLDPGTIGVGVMSFAVAATFLVAGVGKLSVSKEFAESLVRFMVTRRPHLWAARGVALFEIAVAVALWVPMLRIAAAATAFAAFGLFSWLIARSLRAGETFACNCFGSDKRHIDAFTLIRTLALAVLSAALFAALAAGAQGPTRVSDGAVSAAVALAAGLIVALLLQAWRLLRFDQSWASGFRAMGRAATERREGIS